MSWKALLRKTNKSKGRVSALVGFYFERHAWMSVCTVTDLTLYNLTLLVSAGTVELWSSSLLCLEEEEEAASHWLWTSDWRTAANIFTEGTISLLYFITNRKCFYWNISHRNIKMCSLLWSAVFFWQLCSDFSIKVTFSITYNLLSSVVNMQPQMFIYTFCYYLMCNKCSTLISFPWLFPLCLLCVFALYPPRGNDLIYFALQMFSLRNLTVGRQV